MPNRAINAATQIGRVIAIMCDGEPRTLRNIEQECWRRFGQADTQAAISARLREVWRYGYQKDARCDRRNGKQVWFYSLGRMGDAA